MSRQGILFVEHQGEIVGGGQFSLLALMQHLKNYEPHCVTGGTGTMTAAVRERDIAVEVIRMPAIRLSRIAAVWRCVWGVYRLAKKRNVVLLHANGSRCMFYAGLAAKFLRLPVCWHVRINDSDGWWDRLLAGWATCIVVVSPAVAQRFAHLDVGAKVRIIYNGVDLETFAHGDRAVSRARWGWGDRPVVGMVAQLIPLKRHDIFIAAAALLAPRFPEAVFAIVGSEPDPAQGYEALLRSQVAELGLEERVVFTGFCDDAPGLFAAFDIAVLTSENEAFGRVLIEAMAADKPVVATEFGGALEIVVPGQTGLLVPIGDARATADAVGSLLADSDRARALGVAGRERARAKFSIEAHVAQVEALYVEMLKR
ncbi:MAG: glycosyltransferase [Gemmatimonadetes bacterium]|jgi:glycosyltransferase involved in cell wall biosynthesis|nr:glycosyltransferase [Gemmatimonadota bacterium]MBT5324930.1 glycosyltransferase [Gemmatimonadota bacterium]MBT5448470.1 glycosyltransferase [Gemmatimonadota bacterium]MBT5802092.1 glycosyltransferase [Gemmatimonadota bacterium]